MADNTLLILAAELAAKNKAHFPDEIFKPRELCKLGAVDIQGRRDRRSQFELSVRFLTLVW
jgi:hypothetical protein